jgi:mannose-6-phosphate isomerase-like protein (cupin superfamily)
MTKSAPIFVDADGGEPIWYDGGLITFKATGTQTGGALLLFEAMMPRGKATPLHMHPEADETFYLLEGEILAHIDDRQYAVSAGAVTVVPRGTPHAFLVRSETARLLVMFTPASPVSEAFFREAGQPATARTLSPIDANLEETITAARKTGLAVLGPPPFVRASA